MYSKINIKNNSPPHKKIPVNALYNTFQLKVFRNFVEPEIALQNDASNSVQGSTGADFPAGARDECPDRGRGRDRRCPYDNPGAVYSPGPGRLRKS